MANPASLLDDVGEWFEFYNTTSRVIELGGLVLRDDGSDRHVIEGSVTIEPWSYAVFVRAAGATTRWQYLYRSTQLANSEDELYLETIGGDVIAQVLYSRALGFTVPEGASMSLDPLAFDFTEAQDSRNWCAATTVYGAGDRGTPGAPNPPCVGPGLSGVVPSTGLDGGGLEVTITGAGLAGATAVSFGGSAATELTIISDNEITVVTPAHAAGWVNITVTTAGGDLIRDTAFRFTGTESAIPWCRLQFPAELTVATGAESDMIFGQLFLAGRTETAGECDSTMIAHLGYGPLDTDPSVDHAWSWIEAECNPSCRSCGANDEYTDRLTVERAGEYAYAFRFSSDGGDNFIYCDTLADDVPYDGYQTANQGRLTVSAP
jgi:hypothetical protein